MSSFPEMYNNEPDDAGVFRGGITTPPNKATCVEGYVIGC